MEDNREHMKLHRRFLAALIGVALIFPVMVAPVSATVGPCVDPFDTHYFSGMTGGSGSRSGVQASISSNSPGFRDCTGDAGHITEPTAWVSLSPSFYDPCRDCIMQIGIYWGSNKQELRYFYAFGGCNWSAYLQDLWAVGNTLPHTYYVYLGSDNRYHFQIDSVHALSIAQSDPRISCWTGGQKGPIEAMYMFERFDHGDSSGNPTFASTVASAKYGLVNQGWFNVNWYPNYPCVLTADDEYCRTTFTNPSNSFVVYSN